MASFNEVNSLFLGTGPFDKQNHKQEEEPKPLLIDSLLPSSADIDP